MMCAVSVLTIHGIISFVLGASNLIFTKFLRKHPEMEKSSLFFAIYFCSSSCFWLAEATFFNFCVWPLFFLGGWGCFIHFGAPEKDLGCLGLWDCSPYPHKNTNVDQLDSGIAVHGTDMQTNNQE